MKSVLILGAKSDIAIETSKIYARNGWDLILAGRNINEQLLTFKDHLISEFDCNIELCELDILDYKSHEKIIKSLKNKPTGIISYIGYLGDQKSAETDYTETKKIIDSNFTGLISIINIFANYFSIKKKGFIIVITSVAGDRGRKSNYIYASAKSALNTYLSGLRNRLCSKNILLSTIKPGYVKTKMTKELELPAILSVTPKYVAKKVFKAQQKNIEEMYIPGIWLFIMFVIKLIPEKIFKNLNI